MTQSDTERTAGGDAIKELRRRLAEVDGELNELLETQRILQQVNSPIDLLSRLEKEFPKKSRRQLNYLVKAAEKKGG